MFFRKKISKNTISPDEIFVDSKNIPDFDKYQFEGRFEKPITKSTFIAIGACFFLLGGLLFSKVIHLQIIKGAAYASRSQNNYLKLVNIPASRGIIYDRNKAELAWNDLVEEKNSLKFIRNYIDLPGLGHILGYIGFDANGNIIGKDGVEKKYNEKIGGRAGVKIMEKNSKNEIISESIEEPPENGESLYLTIDAKLQSKLYSILGEVIKERGFGGGAGTVIDVQSGEVLALVSYPEYDSKVLSMGGPRDVINDYFQDEEKPFLNRAVSGLYAPGSIIKPLIALAALQEKIIAPDKQILSTGSISLPNPFFPERNSIFKDWKAHGLVDMRKALAVSSNVYFYTVGGGHDDVKGLGISKIEKYASLFGFGLKTNIDLDKEENGVVPSPKLKASTSEDSLWRIGDTFNASIGQGNFQITPLQAAVYAASIANNGRILQPYVVNNEENKQKSLRATKDTGILREHFNIAREGMRRAVTEGTAQGLSGLGVEIAVKTGTAELESGNIKKVNSWLIGFLPYENPKIAFSILLERGKPTNLVGSVFAGRQLFEWMAVYRSDYLK